MITGKLLDIENVGNFYEFIQFLVVLSPISTKRDFIFIQPKVLGVNVKFKNFTKQYTVG